MSASIRAVGSIVRVWHDMCRTDEISFCCLLFAVSCLNLLFFLGSLFLLLLLLLNEYNLRTTFFI